MWKLQTQRCFHQHMALAQQSLHKNTRQGKERKPPIQAASKSQPSMHMKSSLSCHHKPDRQGNPRIHLLSLALQQHRQLPLRSQETCTKVPHNFQNF